MKSLIASFSNFFAFVIFDTSFLPSLGASLFKHTKSRKPDTFFRGRVLARGTVLSPFTAVLDSYDTIDFTERELFCLNGGG